MLRFIAFVTLLAIASATNFNKCKNEVSPSAVRISGCQNMPCSVVKGKDATIEVDFKAINTAVTLNAKVVATAFGIKVPYPLPENLGDVCKNLLNEGYCPLDVDEDATYQLAFPVGVAYPEIPVNIEIKIIDGESKVHACFSIDIQVTSA